MKKKEELLEQIVGACLSIDESAAKGYSLLAEHAQNPDLKALWEEMASNEKDHVAYWQDITSLAQDGELPNIFEKPHDVVEELRCLEAKINKAIEDDRHLSEPINAFLLSYRMEFFLLHPAFESLFHFVHSPDTGRSPEEDYDEHLKRLVEGLRKHDLETPELELLSETIGALWEKNKELIAQSHTDSLTEVYNRRGLFHAITPLAHLAQRKESTVAVLMIDIDNFKKVNDKHGHEAGDSVLALVAHCIHSRVRRSDVVGRYGGEEFLVFLVDTDEDHLREVCERMREFVQEQTSDMIPVTVSIGVAYDKLEGDVEDAIEDMIRKADASLYKAKESGKNRVVLHD